MRTTHRNYSEEQGDIRIQKAPSPDGAFCCSQELVRQGVADGAEGVADLGSEQAHDSDHDDGDESKNDRVLNEALAFFFGCK